MLSLLFYFVNIGDSSFKDLFIQSLKMLLLVILSFTACFLYLIICWVGIYYCSLSREKLIRVLIKGDDFDKSKGDSQMQSKTRSHGKKQ